MRLLRRSVAEKNYSKSCSENESGKNKVQSNERRIGSNEFG